jgi:hypothetical protein
MESFYGNGTNLGENSLLLQGSEKAKEISFLELLFNPEINVTQSLKK